MLKVRILDENSFMKVVNDASLLDFFGSLEDVEEIKTRLKEFGVEASDEEVKYLLDATKLLKSKQDVGHKEIQELSESELGSVSGGGIGFIVLGAIVVLAGAAGAGGLGYSAYKLGSEIFG